MKPTAEEIKMATEFLKSNFPTTYEFLNSPDEACGMLESVIDVMIAFAATREVKTLPEIDGFQLVADFGEAFKHQHIKTQKVKWLGVQWMVDWLRKQIEK